MSCHFLQNAGATVRADVEANSQDRRKLGVNVKRLILVLDASR